MDKAATGAGLSWVHYENTILLLVLIPMRNCRTHPVLPGHNLGIPYLDSVIERAYSASRFLCHAGSQGKTSAVRTGVFRKAKNQVAERLFCTGTAFHL